MGLGLHSYDLHNIANAVDKLSQAGVCVEVAQIGDVRVELAWHSAQDVRDSSYFTVESIERVDKQSLPSKSPADTSWVQTTESQQR